MQDPLDNIQDKERAAGLIAGHLQGTLSDAEQQELDAWIGGDAWNRAYFEQAVSPAFLDGLMSEYHKAGEMESDLRAAIHLKLRRPAGKIIIWKTWIRVAAAIILTLGIGIFTWYKTSAPQPGIATTPAQPVPPGRQGAILTLSDGRQVTLDSLPNGVVADQNGSRAAVVNGQLAYHPVSPATSAITYNTITTPRGRQYQLALPDGTKVWLNAASRIVFPTAFTGKERKVTIDGEAYFEVARDAQRPFRVSAAGTDIEVLGTSFNINAYQDEHDVRTTLMEGSVKVYGAHANIVLKPGQQAVVNHQLQMDADVNIGQVIAWKKGLFDFDSTGIATVMKQLSRWYDIDVRYEGKAPDVLVTGKMDKGLNLNEIMEFLTKMEVKCRLTGRTVIVSNN